MGAHGWGRGQEDLAKYTVLHKCPRPSPAISDKWRGDPPTHNQLFRGAPLILLR